ncbi:Gfo/Idh/MocA family oxidoreductase [bacterium]|nr:Gfo/Idh/MocA family oxidoreductase [bacterium]
METLKIAVVGTGSRARAHLATIPKLTDIYKLVAVCDLNEELAKEVAGQHNVPGYTNVEEMLKTEKPDVVLVAVRPDGHHTITRLAAMYGAHVLTETPIATTLAYADIMINSAKEFGVKLEESENVWRWPHERLKRAIVDAGLIGEVRYAHLWYASGSYHGMNAIRTLIQSEAKCAVGYAPKGPGAPREIGVVEFENGASTLYELPSRRRGNYWEIDGTEGAVVGNELQIYNGRETKSYPIQTITGEVSGKRTIVEARVDTDPPVVWENPLKKYGLDNADDVARAAAHYSIYKAVVEDTEPEYGAENARKDQEILIAIRESALKGSIPIQLPLTEITEHERQLHEQYKIQYGHDPLEVGKSEARATKYE